MAENTFKSLEGEQNKTLSNNICILITTGNGEHPETLEIPHFPPLFVYEGKLREMGWKSPKIQACYFFPQKLNSYIEIKIFWLYFKICQQNLNNFT